VSIFVKFWGTRGSCPTPGAATRRYGGNTSCVEIRQGRQLLICDGGTGLRELGLDLAERHEALVAHMFFSHTHWDHIQGFPFFRPAYHPDSRLYIHSEAGQSHVEKLLSSQMKSTFFPVDFAELAARIEPVDLTPVGGEIDNIEVKTLEQIHPGGSTAYRFEFENSVVIYATDHELDQQVLTPAEIEKDPDKLREFPDELLEFFRGADLLVADAQYTDDEYLACKGWGHARATTTLDLAIQAGAKQLALFHHDPMQSDEDVDRKVEQCKKRAQLHGSELVVFGAREGLELKLG
jgi:phosphoribosyl 1,2-cyclic phosphodiesterase